jgi:lipopolysaccharide transport system ATP-binding protein
VKPAVRVDNLSKCYRLGERRARHNLSETIAAGARGLWRRLALRGSTDAADFWALRGVSFEVGRGEVVGVIGRNGAGKSTLLKILSRIVEPTGGRVEYRGRIASLLEVGTGFHPELTGRENIYLNGSILGMARREIGQRFDEIVAFSEVEQFLDTPVKRYSSGMYVRLAFAVAAHLQPEILVVDEVLAVGDAAFQSKCVNKMQQVGSGGATVLVVSHSMATIQRLCARAVLLEQGGVRYWGETAEAIRRYLARPEHNRPDGGEVSLEEHPGRQPGSKPLMRRLALRSDGEPASQISIGGALDVSVRFSADRPLRHPALGVVLKDHWGTPLFGVNNKFMPGFTLEEPVAEGVITCSFAELPLLPGSYDLDLFFGDQGGDDDVVLHACSLEVYECDYYGTGKLPPKGCGPLAMRPTWSFSSPA